MTGNFKLSPGRMQILLMLHRAGPRGSPEFLLPELDLFYELDLIELYDLPSRVFTHRARLSELGLRVVTTLCLPIEEKPNEPKRDRRHRHHRSTGGVAHDSRSRR